LFNKVFVDFENVESDDWQPGADDVTSIYTYLFIKSNVGNFTALFNYINDWKSSHISLRPVSHVISFFEGFLNYIVDLDPNLTVKQSELGEGTCQSQDDNYVFISKYGLTKQLERGIEMEIFRYQNKKEKIERQLQKPNLPPEEASALVLQQRELQAMSFSWVSPLFLYISLQVGHFQRQFTKQKQDSTQDQQSKLFCIEMLENNTSGSEQNMLVPTIDGSGISLNLAQALHKYINLARGVLDTAKLGFNVNLRTTTSNDGKQGENSLVVVEFEKEPFPSYVYSELSLEIAKFIKFELENADSHLYQI